PLAVALELGLVAKPVGKAVQQAVGAGGLAATAARAAWVAGAAGTWPTTGPWCASTGRTGLAGCARAAPAILAAQVAGGLLFGRLHNLVDLHDHLVAGLQRALQAGQGGHNIAVHLAVKRRGALAHPIAILEHFHLAAQALEGLLRLGGVLA